MTLHTYKGYISYTLGNERGYYLNPDTCELVKVKKSGRIKKIIKSYNYYFKNLYDNKTYFVENNIIKECNSCEENNDSHNLDANNHSSNEIEIKNNDSHDLDVNNHSSNEIETKEQRKSEHYSDNECQENKKKCENIKCFFKLINRKIKKCKNNTLCFHWNNEFDHIKPHAREIVRWEKIIKSKSCSHCIDNDHGTVDFKSKGFYEITSTINYYINSVENKLLLKDLFGDNLSSVSLGNISDDTSFILLNDISYNVTQYTSLVFLVTLNSGCSFGFAILQAQQTSFQQNPPTTVNIIIGFCGTTNTSNSEVQDVFISSFNGFMVTSSGSENITGCKGYLKFNIQSDSECKVGFVIPNSPSLLCTPIYLPYSNIKSYIPAFALIKNDCKIVSLKYLMSQKIPKKQLLEAVFNTFTLMLSSQINVSLSNCSVNVVVTGAQLFSTLRATDPRSVPGCTGGGTGGGGGGGTGGGGGGRGGRGGTGGGTGGTGGGTGGTGGGTGGTGGTGGGTGGT